MLGAYQTALAKVSVFGGLTCTKKIYLSHSFENSNIGQKSCNDDYIAGFFVNINVPFFHSISFLSCPNSALNKKGQEFLSHLF